MVLTRYAHTSSEYVEKGTPKADWELMILRSWGSFITDPPTTIPMPRALEMANLIQKVDDRSTL